MADQECGPLAGRLFSFGLDDIDWHAGRIAIPVWVAHRWQQTVGGLASSLWVACDIAWAAESQFTCSLVRDPAGPDRWRLDAVFRKLPGQLREVPHSTAAGQHGDAICVIERYVQDGNVYLWLVPAAARPPQQLAGPAAADSGEAALPPAAEIGGPVAGAAAPAANPTAAGSAEAAELQPAAAAIAAAGQPIAPRTPGQGSGGGGGGDRGSNSEPAAAAAAGPGQRRKRGTPAAAGAAPAKRARGRTKPAAVAAAAAAETAFPAATRGISCDLPGPSQPPCPGWQAGVAAPAAGAPSSLADPAPAAQPPAAGSAGGDAAAPLTPQGEAPNPDEAAAAAAAVPMDDANTSQDTGNEVSRAIVKVGVSSECHLGIPRRQAQLLWREADRSKLPAPGRGADSKWQLSIIAEELDGRVFPITALRCKSSNGAKAPYSMQIGAGWPGLRQGLDALPGDTLQLWGKAEPGGVLHVRKLPLATGAVRRPFPLRRPRQGQSGSGGLRRRRKQAAAAAAAAATAASSMADDADDEPEGSDDDAVTNEPEASDVEDGAASAAGDSDAGESIGTQQVSDSGGAAGGSGAADGGLANDASHGRPRRATAIAAGQAITRTASRGDTAVRGRHQQRQRALGGGAQRQRRAPQQPPGPQEREELERQQEAAAAAAGLPPNSKPKHGWGGLTPGMISELGSLAKPPLPAAVDGILQRVSSKRNMLNVSQHKPRTLWGHDEHEDQRWPLVGVTAVFRTADGSTLTTPLTSGDGNHLVGKAGNEDGWARIVKELALKPGDRIHLRRDAQHWDQVHVRLAERLPPKLSETDMQGFAGASEGIELKFEWRGRELADGKLREWPWMTTTPDDWRKLKGSCGRDGDRVLQQVVLVAPCGKTFLITLKKTVPHFSGSGGNPAFAKHFEPRLHTGVRMKALPHMLQDDLFLIDFGGAAPRCACQH